MKESFSGLIEALRKNREKCPYAKQLDIPDMAVKIGEEVQELREAVEKKDHENMKEEIGDVIMVAVHFAMMCEDHGYFKAKEVLEDVTAKLVRRKPWVFGNMKVNTPEEAMRIWKRIKKEEKR